MRLKFCGSIMKKLNPRMKLWWNKWKSIDVFKLSYW